jgi:hypothetical protein
MGLEILVPILMGALLKVVGKVGEGVLSAVEETAKEGATSMFAKIKAWWSKDKSASDDLSKFEEEPDIYTPVIEARLVKKLTAEPDKQAEFAAMLGGMGPQVEVFQTIAEAHGITGAKIEELVSGRVHVDQRVDHASDIVGVDIKRMGSPG